MDPVVSSDLSVTCWQLLVADAQQIAISDLLVTISGLLVT